MNQVPKEMINKIIMYSYSFIWNDIHNHLHLHFCIKIRKQSLEWLLFKKLLHYYYINGQPPRKKRKETH